VDKAFRFGLCLSNGDQKMKKILRVKSILFLAASSIVLLTLGCGVVAAPTVAPNQVETIVAGTLQALTPLASATLSVTANTPTLAPTITTIPIISSPLPTITSQPTTQPPVGTQIVFPTGGTYGVVSGTIQANQNLDYYLKAAKGQPMIAILNSQNNDVAMSIRAQDGTVLLPAAQKSSLWQGTLPGTQNYYFQVIGGSGTENFTLSVNIPARIQFAAGQNSAVFNGRTVNGYAVSYVAYALGGQTLEATVNTSPDDAALTIWGFSDGQPYARAQNGVTNFSMKLPSTQDYIIDVMPQGGRVIDYSLTVKIQ
jgi:hypothetical protein